MPENYQVKAKNEALENLVLNEMFDYLVVVDPQFEEMCQGQFTMGSGCLRKLGSVLLNSNSRYELGYGNILCFGVDFSKGDKLKESYLEQIDNNPSVIKAGQNRGMGFYMIEKPEIPSAA